MDSLQILFLYRNWKVANLRLVAAEGRAPPRSTSSECWLGRRFSGNANFIIGFEPSSGLEVILLSWIQKSIKDTLNNVLDEQLDGSLVPESENQRGLQRLAEVRTGSDAK